MSINNGENLFTIHQYHIKVPELNKPIYLIPFGDIHRFARMCDVDRWLEFLAWAKAKPNCYFLGMGDYDDLCSFSERKVLMDQALHDETRNTLDDIYQKRVNDLTKEIGFMAPKLIGLIEGNHYGVFQSGITTTQMMCDKLKCKYLGVSAFIRLSMIYGRKRTAIDIWAHHGKGASRLVGGSLNSVQQMMDGAEADIYLQGHDHKKSAASKSKLRLGGGGGVLKLTSRKVLLARTGSFLKGYIPEQGSYIVRTLLSPCDLGTLKIELTCKRDKKNKNDDFYTDIHCSL